MNTFRKIATAFLIVVALTFSASAFANPEKSGVVPEQEHLEMLYPTVLVRLGNGSGSGTVIYSKQNEDQA